jgi:L-seryl-tRNA(Ser) seleniumtransferase
MTLDKQTLFKNIPAVDRLLTSGGLGEASARYGRNLVLRAVHEVLEEIRHEITGGAPLEASDLAVGPVSERVVKHLSEISRSSLRAVINATGVVVHTNLGRSILPERALEKFRPLSGGYSNLEYDLALGKRGSRYSHVEGILKELTSAESAVVVNNNAAAVLVSLDTLAKGREVIVSRGQLVEIGGSFRIPEVMKKSGAKMVEVGTTNKTHLRDYEEVMSPQTGLLLKVHTSNFQVMGFTEEVPLSDLVGLGRQYGIPVMEDLGSGCLIDFSKHGLTKEPTVQEALAQGADLVTFSGDKLLGGPQAGIILGRKDLVEAIKRNQLSRALRIDKLTLLALEETLRLYRDEEAALKEIPTLRMICEPYETLAKRAECLLETIGELNTQNFAIELADGASRVGGGALPLLQLPSRLLCLNPGRLSPHRMESWFRSYEPPIIARLEKERVLLDLRTIQEEEMEVLSRAIRELSAIEEK